MTNDTPTWQMPYTPATQYQKRVAYFSMEFAIDQYLKVYSGGLGFLAGSHMRSAYHLKQNMIGIGMLWKYGYYDQIRDEVGFMKVLYQRKYYTFLKDTGIVVPVYIKNHQIFVKALYLEPELFGTVPMYFLTTDIPENDHLSQTITHRLYDSNESTRIAQNIVLGVGGAKVVEALGGAEIYHMNEAHALPLSYYLYNKFGSLEETRNHIVFTTHTPEKAGNTERNIFSLDEMGFFNGVSLEEARKITQTEDDVFKFTPAALRISRKANGVSALHGDTANKMWADVDGKCEIISITNAQNQKYWQDRKLAEAHSSQNDEALVARKRELKKKLFGIVADQTGKLFDIDTLTIVWARRFAEYKRADLIMRDIMRFNTLITQTDRPVQIIWAGKPYPEDHGAISLFNHIRSYTYKKKNVAVLTGYELKLSSHLKKGSDIWLNTPRRPQEASGTSGMTAAMNGSLALSTYDGWIPEYAKHGVNCFVIPPADPTLQSHEQDDMDHLNLMQILEDQILPLYYDTPQQWLQVVKQAMSDVNPAFGSDRMAHEYYEKLYNA
jgi:starch phosphorylase